MFSAFFHSYLFAQILGFYFLIMAVILLARVGFYRRLLMGLSADYGTIVTVSSFALIMGLLIVITHNFWIEEPHILLVTIIGWLLLISAVLWLAFPDTMAAYCKKLYAGAGYYVLVAIFAVIGILLIAKGFYHFHAIGALG